MVPMTDVVVTAAPRQRRRIVVHGVVQGVGFRPFVARVAAELDLTGHCGNDQASVFIEAEGSAEALAELVRRLHEDAPPMARVEDVQAQPLAPRGDSTFAIVPSRTRLGVRTLVSPDVGTCRDCRAEMADPQDRRFRHPFITCTNCGPRFTIIQDLPYDRPATTMAAFEMCPQCRAEYDDPGNRRHHAQPISCHDCGPRLWLEQDGQQPFRAAHEGVIAHAQRAAAGGRDPRGEGSGRVPPRLRRRQRRSGPDAAHAQAAAGQAVRGDGPRRRHGPDLRVGLAGRGVDPDAAGSPDRPAPQLSSTPLADGVAPDLDETGVMLPYTPVHHLLLEPVDGVDTPGILVMTSGNLADEPLCHRNEDARTRLADLADAFLMHDRDIAVPCDDSVVALGPEGELPVRRSRGFAPLPVRLADSGPVTLAVGGEVKNTFCLAREGMAFCSGHLGDMGSLETLRAFEMAVEQMVALHAAEPELVVADDHPGYATRDWAERYSVEHDVPLVTVQHHHAHVASLLAEHDLVGTPVIGVAYDGTGYGCDRSVWGGELLAVGADVGAAARVGHLEPFALAGGDLAVRSPFRIALALLDAAEIPDSQRLALSASCPGEVLRAVRSQLASGIGCVQTTSMGRLFDGVASLLGVRHYITYEAQAAVELEALARTSDHPVPLTMDIEGGELRLGRLVRSLVGGMRAGRSAADLARGFHEALAAATARLVIRTAKERGVDLVGLTGGVFQNRLLLDLMAAELRSSGLSVLTHQRVPPNDGGLSLGQVVVGRARAARGLDAMTGTTGGAT